MIAFLNSFYVPGLDYITIYPDHLSPYKFYYFKSRPRICTDKDGFPDIRLTMIQNSMDSEQSQLATLLLVTDLGLTTYEESMIRQYLDSRLTDESYLNQMEQFYPLAHKKLLEDKKTNPNAKRSVELGGISPRDGECRLELMEGLEDERFLKKATEKRTPTLNGTFNCAVSASFGDLGSQLMYECLTGGFRVKDGLKYPVMAIVDYHLKNDFFVPALDAEVHVDSSAVFEKTREYVEMVVKKKVDLPGNIIPRIMQEKLFLTKKEIVDVLKTKTIKDAGITISSTDYSDISGVKSDELDNKVLESLMGIITDSLLPNIFKLDPAPEGDGKEATYTLNDTPKDIKQTINFTLRKNATVQLDLPANASLFATVPSTDKDSLITYVDISHTEFMKQSVPVTCMANLDADQIESINVWLQYDHVDKRFPSLKENDPKTFRFTTGNETYIFDFMMAKDDSKKFIRDFVYKTQINYPGRASGAWSKPVRVHEDFLRISYEDLGYINVVCKAGDIDWREVETVFVDLEYPSAKGEKDVTKRLAFTQENAFQPQSWSCFKYGYPDKEYTYTVRFVDKDGGEYPKNPQPKTCTDEELVINDLYAGQSMKAVFRVNFNPDVVEKVLLNIYYEDKAKGISKNPWHEFSDDDRSWEWSMRIQEGASEKIRYTYRTFYRDGTLSGVEEFTAKGRLPEIDIYDVRKPSSLSLSLTVSARPLRNWEQWDFAQVFIRYSDPARGIDKPFPVIELDAGDYSKTIEEDCPPDAPRTFLCRALIYTNIPGKAPIEIPEAPYSGAFTLTVPENA